MPDNKSNPGGRKTVHSLDNVRKRKSEKKRRRVWSVLWAGTLLAVLGAVMALSWMSFAPLTIKSGVNEIIVNEGLSATGIGRDVVRQGVELTPQWFGILARLRGKANRLKAGSYELAQQVTVWGLIDILSRGDIRYREFRIAEGSTFEQLRRNLATSPDLRHDSSELTEQEILQRIGAGSVSHAEGLFYPDTYLFSKNNSDFAILNRAYTRQKKELDLAWQQRQPEVPLKSPYEALILASIVEKETGRAADRGKVASVFVNRLRIGMMLQTDPTVIYGLGNQFDGNLRKFHLQTDNPYNTYTRTGLPPTPIAMPGKAALWAAVHPEATPFLYFVARGDGSSQFSATLNDHNRAVNKFQRGQ